MTRISSEEEKERKKAIFESMSQRRQEHILKKMGYEKWDPFQEPKDPIDLREDKTKRTTQQLAREFLQTRSSEEYTNEYGRGVFEMCLGIVNDDDKYRGMLEFAVWYKELLKREGSE